MLQLMKTTPNESECSLCRRPLLKQPPAAAATGLTGELGAPVTAADGAKFAIRCLMLGLIETPFKLLQVCAWTKMSRVSGLSPGTDRLFYPNSIRAIVAADGFLGLFKGWQIVVFSRAMDEKGTKLIKRFIDRFVPASGLVTALNRIELNTLRSSTVGQVLMETVMPLSVGILRQVIVALLLKLMIKVPLEGAFVKIATDAKTPTVFRSLAALYQCADGWFVAKCLFFAAHGASFKRVTCDSSLSFYQALTVYPGERDAPRGLLAMFFSDLWASAWLSALDLCAGQLVDRAFFRRRRPSPKPDNEKQTPKQLEFDSATPA
jgi:hypothetical protein